MAKSDELELRSQPMQEVWLSASVAASRTMLGCVYQFRGYWRFVPWGLAAYVTENHLFDVPTDAAEGLLAWWRDADAETLAKIPNHHVITNVVHG